MSFRTDPFARDIADRHYNRQNIGAKGFAPPGRCLVLKAESPTGRAFWITSWPFAEYVKHDWAGAWVCSAFRNENCSTASLLISQALQATQAYYGEPPKLGLITFLDMNKVRPTMVRGAATWGRTWEKVGFRHVGYTKSGLMAFQLPPEDFPDPFAPAGFCGPHNDFRSDGTLVKEWVQEACLWV